MSEETNTPQEAKKPGRPPKVEAPESELPTMAEMMKEMAALREMVLAGQQKGGTTRRKHVKEHYANLREFRVDADGNFDQDGTPVGIVTELLKPREIADDSGMNRYKGICNLEVINPETGKTKIYKDVDWIRFLEQSPRVRAKIEKIDSEELNHLDKRDGGGGVAMSSRYDNEGRHIADVETEYWVTETRNTYTLLVEEGLFAGFRVVNTGKGINI